MHIAFLDSIEKNIYGGMEEWIRLVGFGLAERDHTISLIGREQSEFLRRCQTEKANINLLPLKISGDFNPSTISTINGYLKEKQVDCISVNFNKDIRLGGLAARIYGDCKVIWSVGLDITKDSFIHKLLTPKLIDTVVVPSYSLKSEITRLGYIDPEIVEVIPIGINDVHLTESKEAHKEKLISMYNLPEESILAVTSGRFVDQKGHDILVEAIPEIIKQIPKLRFLFLGEGPNRNKLTARINELGINEYVIFAGMLDAVDEYLGGADLMVHPSRFEPFGIAVLEGMRAGLPIVASRVGGIPEVVQENENALLVEPEKADLLSSAVVKLINDSEMFIEFGHNSRLRFEQKFQYEHMLDRVEQLYQTVITKGKVQS